MRWLLLLACLSACNGADTTAAASGSAAAPSSAPAPSAAVPRPPHAGTWRGDFVAKKGDVEIPEGVPYKWWKEDEGTDAAGKGEVAITIGDDGTVDGALSGALGAPRVRGSFADGVLSAGVTSPDEDELGMHGVLTGALKDGVIHAALRVSSHDAALVRTADLQLSKAGPHVEGRAPHGEVTAAP